MRILSWNIASLPNFINFYSNPKERIEIIIKKILYFNADIVCLQEVLDKDIYNILEYQLKKNNYKIHQYNSIPENNCFNYIRNNIPPYSYDSGLFFASKIKFDFNKFICYNDCTGEDSLISKGFQVFTLDDIKIYHTHMQADFPIFSFSWYAKNIIKKQIDQLVNSISNNHKNILIGDFNIYKNSDLYNYFISLIKKKGITTINGDELDYIILNNYEKKTDYFIYKYDELSDHPLLLSYIE